MTEETFRLVQTTQIVVVTTAVFVGGGWALYRFLHNLQAALEIRISTRELGPGSADDRCLVEAVVEIENKGTRNCRLPWKRQEDEPWVQPFSVYRASLIDGELVHKDKQAHAVRVSRCPDTNAPATIIRAGATERIPFVLELERGNLYLLTFVAHLAERDRRKSERAGTPGPRPTSWTGRKYISVS